MAESNISFGLNLWNQSWNDVRNNLVVESRQNLLLASRKFNSALNLYSENPRYSHFYKLCKSIIDGNSFFNEGIMLQNQGYNLSDNSYFESATTKFTQAIENFLIGLEFDSRLQSCIDTVQLHIDKCLNYNQNQNQNYQIQQINIDQLPNEQFQSNQVLYRHL